MGEINVRGEGVAPSFAPFIYTKYLKVLAGGEFIGKDTILSYAASRALTYRKTYRRPGLAEYTIFGTSGKWWELLGIFTTVKQPQNISCEKSAFVLKCAYMDLVIILLFSLFLVYFSFSEDKPRVKKRKHTLHIDLPFF